MSSELIKSSQETTASNPAGTKADKDSIRKQEKLVESSGQTTASNKAGDKFSELERHKQKRNQKQKETPTQIENNNNNNNNNNDIPATDEIAAAAETIKQDISQSVNQTAKQTEKKFKGIFRKIRGIILGNFHGIRGSVRHLSSSLFRGIQRNEWSKKQLSTSTQFWNDLISQPTPVKALFCCIFVTNCILPLLFLNRSEGVVVFCTYICVSILSHFLYQKTASPDKFRSISLSHLLWVPMLFWLLSRSGSTDKITESTHMDHVFVSLTLNIKRSWFFSQWIRLVLLINSLALSVDALQMGQLYQQKTGGSLGLPGEPIVETGKLKQFEKLSQKPPRFVKNQDISNKLDTSTNDHIPHAHAAPTA